LPQYQSSLTWLHVGIVHEDVYVAPRDGFDSVMRQLGGYVYLMRRKTKKHAAEQVGHVLRLSPKEGIGFIAGPDICQVEFTVLI
jgi:hypothetical protein